MMNKARFLSGTIIGSAFLLIASPAGAASAADAAQPAGGAPAADPPQSANPGTGTRPLDQGQQSSADGTASDGGSIVVTGSRIRRPLNETSNVPVTTLTAGELTNTGSVSIGDQLNTLPSMRATFSQQNSTRFLGTTGLNLLDLRGLGPQRTLVLVNGRRHVGWRHPQLRRAVDINTIPTDLIEHVDVVTGGDSAVYGSDAIAGVVNFVLKDHFDGVAIHGQEGSASTATPPRASSA